MEIIVGGFIVGLVVAPIVILVLWIRMVSRTGRQQATMQAQAAVGGVVHAVDPALLAPRNTAELRMWENHFGLPAMRGLTPDQRIAEIVQLRIQNGV